MWWCDASAVRLNPTTHDRAIRVHLQYVRALASILAFVVLAVLTPSAMAGGSIPARIALATAGGYTALDPARVLDTRGSVGGFNGQPVGPAATIAVQVAGRGGVPASGAAAVVVNVTATKPTTNGYLTVFPSASTRPVTSNLNFSPGQTVPNLVVVRLGADGKVAVFNSGGTTHVLMDVAGWYAAGPAGAGGYTALDPARVLDTRGSVGGFNGQPVGPAATIA
ncbi:hypothetical protein, partial [Knoellia alttitudinis]|uniref:hypothetical protein n=1 Tax=Knoellia altitudinis TaxID=3404795 RepID=UPI003618356C